MIIYLVKEKHFHQKYISVFSKIENNDMVYQCLNFNCKEKVWKSQYCKLYYDHSQKCIFKLAIEKSF